MQSPWAGVCQILGACLDIAVGSPSGSLGHWLGYLGQILRAFLGGFLGDSRVKPCKRSGGFRQFPWRGLGQVCKVLWGDLGPILGTFCRDYLADCSESVSQSLGGGTLDCLSWAVGLCAGLPNAIRLGRLRVLCKIFCELTSVVSNMVLVKA